MTDIATPHRCTAPLYEVTGTASAPVIVVLGGISSTRHVTSTDEDRSVGWWQDIVGSGRAIDTAEYRIVSFDYLDGGSTADGRPATLVSTHDQADALAIILDAIGVDRVYAVVGASYGGMVALAFADRYPGRIERLAIIGASHEPHPMSTALRSIQRRVVTLGLETGRAQDSLALARALAMTTYRSAREFGSRFDTAPATTTGADAVFPVESYLLHNGEKFARSWSPSRFLALSLSADLHRIDPRSIHTPSVLITIDSDAIVPREQIEQLAANIAGPHRIVRIAAITGHDAFLTEPDTVGPILHNALHTEFIS
jgi:homoserine O-acetyltransferase